jgi:hypothetical protein
MATIQIELPDATAQAAQALERLLSDALRTRSLTVLDNSLAKLAADPLPPMSEDEIQAEIEAHRAEKRAAARS